MQEQAAFSQRSKSVTQEHAVILISSMGRIRVRFLVQQKRIPFRQTP